jgi:hypothetical protein
MEGTPSQGANATRKAGVRVSLQIGAQALTTRQFTCGGIFASPSPSPCRPPPCRSAISRNSQLGGRGSREDCDNAQTSQVRRLSSVTPGNRVQSSSRRPQPSATLTDDQDVGGDIRWRARANLTYGVPILHRASKRSARGESEGCLTCRLHVRLPQSPLSKDRGHKRDHGKCSSIQIMQVAAGGLGDSR